MTILLPVANIQAAGYVALARFALAIHWKPNCASLYACFLGSERNDLKQRKHDSASLELRLAYITMLYINECYIERECAVQQ